MFSTFNMGLGLIVVVAKEDVAAGAEHCCNARGVEATEVGRVEQGQGEATAVIEP